MFALEFVQGQNMHSEVIHIMFSLPKIQKDVCFIL